ncbi:uncharacterized protein LOC8288466 isoform X2 [Ricinus communis]|uniref:uncharacterized protein LOC8288466 isoform X2 n=1 Tax=Ricinus communis TaxID=3988 RepID=UPI00201AF348|nr:uncharacterized protein LOC8288466 isoform X2 [Ricinus communis]
MQSHLLSPSKLPLPDFSSANNTSSMALTLSPLLYRERELKELPTQQNQFQPFSLSPQEERKLKSKNMGREVSESCIDSLLTEMVSSYCNRFDANKPELAGRRIEAIGYQVGHQLAERFICGPYKGLTKLWQQMWDQNWSLKHVHLQIGILFVSPPFFFMKMYFHLRSSKCP